MRNYSHFVQGDEWTPLSKGDKRRMQDILLSPPFPVLAAIAQSGQKHIVFRAQRNPPESSCGWVQFEEQSLFVHPQELRDLLDIIEALYAHFSKGEIDTGDYKAYRVRQFGVDRWQYLETKIRPRRGGLLFKLGLFLAQRRDDDGKRTGTRASDGDALGSVARSASGVQENICSQNLGNLSERDTQRSAHNEQPGQVLQLALFEVELPCGKR
jgi:hypothetical protein